MKNLSVNLSSPEFEEQVSVTHRYTKFVKSSFFGLRGMIGLFYTEEVNIIIQQ